MVDGDRQGLVLADFDVPEGFDGPGFRLEPLGPEHNERDHAAWIESIEHIKSTPGMGGPGWPTPMSLEENLADLEKHAAEFEARVAFAYSILDGDEVIGCVYVNPPRDDATDAHVRSWMTEGRAEMDPVVWATLSGWLIDAWPFSNIEYASR